MTRLVIDASALVEYLLRTPRAGPVESLLVRADTDAHAPALVDVEVASVLRRGLLEGRLEIARAEHAVEDLRDLPLTRHGHGILLPRILELRKNFSAYDAAYVALAERLEATLVTADHHLGRATRRHTGIDVARDIAR